MDSTRTNRAVALLAILLASASALRADEGAKLSLSPHRRVDELSRVEVALEVGGDLKLVGEGNQKKSIPMSVLANIAYDERITALDAAEQPARALRHYEDVRAVIKVDQGGERPTLDKQHQLIAAVRAEKGAPTLYCPQDPLSRDELDLIDVPANSLVIDQLLPSEPVAQGDSWKPSDQAVCDLLGLDAVSWSEVQCMFGELKDNLAEVSAAGSLHGAAGGVSTEIEIKAKYRFDIRAKRITYLALLIKEKRAVGHVGPGLDTVAKLIMNISPIAQSPAVTNASLRIPASLTPEQSRLNFRAQQGGYGFTYDRRWFVTSDEPKLAVLRLLDRGELVAQCNVSPLPVTSKAASLAEFQEDVQKSLGKNFGQFLAASQSTNESGYAVFRVVVSGVVSQLPIEWVYYLIANDKGQRVTLAFTYEQTLAEQFAEADRALAGQIRFLEGPAPTAAKPVQSR